MSKYKVEIELMPHSAGFSYPVSIVDGKCGRPVGHGNHSRHVYFHGPIVVKIDQDNVFNHLPNESQCYNEHVFWQSIRQKQASKLFAPILQYGQANCFRYVVQPRVKFSNNGKAKAQHYDAMMKIQMRFGLTDICLAGDSGDNWGVTPEGKIIIYDYGFSCPEKAHWPEFKVVV